MPSSLSDSEPCDSHIISSHGLCSVASSLSGAVKCPLPPVYNKPRCIPHPHRHEESPICPGALYPATASSLFCNVRWQSQVPRNKPENVGYLGDCVNCNHLGTEFLKIREKTDIRSHGASLGRERKKGASSEVTISITWIPKSFLYPQKAVFHSDVWLPPGGHGGGERLMSNNWLGHLFI